jgi:hypothetical protein
MTTISNGTVMDFTSLEAFSQLEVVKDDRGYDVATLPVGAKVYRGDARGRKKDTGPNENLPAFFSDIEIATLYSKPKTDMDYAEQDWEREKDPKWSPVTSYVTTKPARLFVMNHSNFTTLSDQQETDEPKHFIWMNYLSKSVPHRLVEHFKKFMNVPVTMDTGIITPYTTRGRLDGFTDYSNRKLARMVCAAGFDGWVAFPRSLIEEVGNTTAVYNHEIMLCNWAVVSKRVSGGRRKKTRRRQAGRKTKRRF